MDIIVPAVAGSMESSDIMVRVEPKDTPGVELHLTSSVMQQYGRQIESVIRDTLKQLDVDSAYVDAVDKGALDCTIRARVSAAAYRSAKRQDYSWEVKA